MCLVNDTKDTTQCITDNPLGQEYAGVMKG